MKLEECWYKAVCFKDCRVSCIRFATMKSLCSQSHLPESKWAPVQLTTGATDLEAFDTLSDIKTNIKDFVSGGKNLYLFSYICGNGKTSWAIKLLLSYFNNIWETSGFNCKGIFVNTPTFLTMCKRNISHPSEDFEQYLSNIVQSDIVIWDDIASTKLSDYDYSLLLTYIDQRFLGKRSNIFTGNCDAAECKELLGQRLKSRIFGSDYIIELKENDKRGINHD